MFFRKNKKEDLINFVKEVDVQNTNWSILGINYHYFQESKHTRQLELHTDDSLYKMDLAFLNENESFVECRQNNKKKFKGRYHESDISDNFHSLFDEVVSKHLEDFKSHIKEISTEGDLEKEKRAHEWLRVTLELTNKAFNELLNESSKPLFEREYLFQCLLFMGKRPETNEKKLRILCFNLDIDCTFLKDGNMRVLVYNNKDQGVNSKSNPDLVGDFNLMKREMLDLLIGLLSKIGSIKKSS